MEYRTIVETGDEEDHHPGMVASVEESGTLCIHNVNGDVETGYDAHEWTSFTVWAE